MPQFFNTIPISTSQELVDAMEKFRRKECTPGRYGWTLVELRQMCSELGLSVSRNKSLMCNTIQRYFESLSQIFSTTDSFENLGVSENDIVEVNLPDDLRVQLSYALRQHNFEFNSGSSLFNTVTEQYRKLLRARETNPNAALDHMDPTRGRYNYVVNICVDIINSYVSRNTSVRNDDFGLPNVLRAQFSTAVIQQHGVTPFTPMYQDLLTQFADQYRVLLRARETHPNALLTGNSSGQIFADIINRYVSQTENVSQTKNVKVEEDESNYTETTSSIDSVVHEQSVPEHCSNDNLISLETYTSEDKPILLYSLNSQNKYERALCITLEELTESIKSDLNVFPPNNFMTIYTSPNDSNVAGYGTKPTGKIVFKLPVNNIFITLGSLESILSKKEQFIKEFYIQPLFNGKRRRLGNIKGIFGASMNHGQVPGFVINKIYTKDEIKNNVIVKESYTDYPTFICENMTPLIDLGIDVTSLFTKNMIHSLLRL